MTRANSFNVTITTDQVVAAATSLEHIDGATINRLLTQVVTEVAGRFDTRARRAMTAGIALDDGYVSSRMEVERTANVPRIEITAAGPGRAGRKGLTILGHYSPQVTTAAAPRAKGDPKRGVAAGYKAAGVSVMVTRGARKAIPGAFTMTLRRGTVAGDSVGVFTRRGGKVKHLYGVSPYSLFRFQIEKGEGELGAELEREALAAIDKAVAL